MAKQETIHTKVERILFPKDGQPGEFFIIACDCGTCKGTMKWRPDEGAKLGMLGMWETYKGALQFSFKEVWHDIPEDPKALLHYACELTTGIGPAMEKTIWEKYGDNWRDLKCDDIPKLRGSVLNDFRDVIQKLGIEKDKTEAVSWLISIGGTRNMAEKAWSKWKKNTIGLVKEDPFILAELPFYGFTDIDNGIRLRFGIGDTDTRRVKAAIRYYMGQLTDDGPTVVSWWALRDKILFHLRNLPPVDLSKAVAEMMTDGVLVGFAESMKLALLKDYTDEVTIWKFANKE